MTKSGMLWVSLGASFLLHIVLMVFVNVVKPEMVRVEASAHVMTFAFSEPASPPLPSVREPEPQPKQPRIKQAQKPLQTARKLKPQVKRKENPSMRQVREPSPPALQPMPAALQAKPVETAPEPSAPQVSPDMIGKYLSKVRSRVASKKFYPPIATRHNMFGTVRMRLRIDALGNVGKPAVVLSSGFQAIDDAAVDAALKAAPFEPPGKYGLSPMTVEIPVIYKLQ